MSCFPEAQNSWMVVSRARASCAVLIRFRYFVLGVVVALRLPNLKVAGLPNLIIFRALMLFRPQIY